jgi:sortase (surface protein transpeptidase)
MTTRKSKEEVKKITEDKKKETISKKHLYMALGDMVQVLIGYLEIDNFKVTKLIYLETQKTILQKHSEKDIRLRSLCHAQLDQDMGRY